MIKLIDELFEIRIAFVNWVIGPNRVRIDTSADRHQKTYWIETIGL